MAGQSLTFYTDATHTQKYMIPYIGDITGKPSVNPSMVGLSSSTNNLLNTIQFGTTFEVGRRNVNFLLQQGDFCIYSSATMIYGIRCWMDGDRPKVANKNYQGWGLRASEMTAGMTLALAKLNGNIRLGVVVWGTAYQGINRAIFCTAYDLDIVYDTIKKTGDPFNPYSGGGYTTPGGGEDSNYDDTSDSVLPDSMPTIGAVGSGLISVFAPSESQVADLASALWGEDFFDFVNKMVSNLDDLFVSFGMVPFTVPKGATVKVRYWSTAPSFNNVYLTLAADQFIEINMGSIDLADNSNIHTTDSVFDYSPFSKLGIYLPFIGFEELDIDEFRGRVVNLKYRIDIVSGTAIAQLTIDGDKTLYQFSGNCLTQIPITSASFDQMVANSVSIAAALASAGATSAVAGAGAEAIEAAQSGGKIGAEVANYRHAQQAAQVSNATGSLGSTTANSMMGIKPNYKHTGAIGASGSMLAVKQPYLFLTTPEEAVPEGYEKYCGFPSNITSRLGDLSGYTVVQDIRLNGLVATSDEVSEIYDLLKKGVII